MNVLSQVINQSVENGSMPFGGGLPAVLYRVLSGVRDLTVFRFPALQTSAKGDQFHCQLNIPRFRTMLFSLMIRPFSCAALLQAINIIQQAC